jgi:predicted molibdopterin-dependent oxidoreductase YjgC
MNAHLPTHAFRIRVDGADIDVPAGVTLAVALLGAGISTFRRSVLGGPRGPVCAMGTCFECRVTVDGEAHVRACLIEVRDGMEVRTGD